MAHLNRRSDDPSDGRRHRVLEAVESTQAKVVARVITPALLMALLGVVVWIGQSALQRQEEQRSDIAQIKSDLRVLSIRFDEGALREIASHTSRIEMGDKKDVEQDRRLDAIERAVRTP